VEPEMMAPPILQKFGSDNFKGDMFTFPLGLLYLLASKYISLYLEAFFYLIALGGNHG
jgi:hypothetical protein